MKKLLDSFFQFFETEPSSFRNELGLPSEKFRSGQHPLQEEFSRFVWQ
jgi:hypothetical protein